MSSQTLAGADNAAIRKIIDDHAQAHARKDADAIVADCAPDALFCILAPPLAQRGGDRAGLESWLSTWDGPISLTHRDLNISTGDAVAFATSLCHMTGRKTDGEDVDVWFRSTVCFEKTDGRWRLVHEHTSVPFHMDGSYRAAVDLTP